MARVAVIGLEGLDPDLVGRWSDELPNLMTMQKEGVWGDLQSIVPPTTAAAWTTAQCGRNQGSYGFWDTTYRDDFSYGEPKLVSSQVIQERARTLYAMLSRSGQRVGIVNVPFTWPPVKIPGGYCISGFTTPDFDCCFSYPPEFTEDITRLVGDYIIDVPVLEANLSGARRESTLKRIYQMDSQRFTLLKHFVCEKKCDYTFSVTHGSDRLTRLSYGCHGQKGEMGGGQALVDTAMKGYYRFIDGEIGKVREALDPDTVLFVHSCYGVQATEGVININEWLVQNGYMTLFEYPSQMSSVKNLRVNWNKTKAWATGSAGHIYLNLKGREAQGALDPRHYDEVLDELTDRLGGIAVGGRDKLNTQLFRRDDICFGPFTEYGPDSFVSIDTYRWGTSELVGHGKGTLCLTSDAETAYRVRHGVRGYFCLAGPKIPVGRRIEDASLLNIAPTVLDIMALSIPADMEAPSVLAIVEEREAPPSKDLEKTVRSRLEALGY